jgi:hypothetical protein
MTEDRNTQDALVLIYTRNEFYRKKYLWVLSVCALGLILIVALVGMLLYITRHPLEPLYFTTDKAGRLIQEVPVTSPNMSTDDVARWAVQAVIAANTYDFVNFHAQLQSAQKYFTDYGWRNYMKGLQASNNLLALTERKLIFLATQAGPVKLVAEGPVGRAAIYGYKFEIPMLITYLLPPYDGVNQKSKFANAYIFTVLIERQSFLNSDQGLGIMQIIGASASDSSGTLSASS